VKLAIIGSGIAGLTAAYHLQRGHEITVFEANDYPGGHAHTVDVAVDGRSYAIDTGFIVFNQRTYPRFVQLLTELGVASRPTEMSFSVRDERDGLEYNGGSLNGLFAQRRNLCRPSFYRMLADILRFNQQARATTGELSEDLTVGDFLRRYRYSTPFAEQYLLPMGAAIWSCPLGRFADFPWRFVAEFYRNHGLLDLWNRPIWRVIDGGSRTYVERLAAGFWQRLRLNTPIASVRRFEDRVDVQPRVGPLQMFDHVVFACHSDQALRILGTDATATERRLLSAFPYERNVAVLHTDASFLPRCRRAWASWNYRIRRGDSTAAPVDVTYNMNILQGLSSPQPFCVTLNPRESIDPRKVHGEYVYHHPVFTRERSAAQQRHAELCHANRTSFCGAYWRNGFHEDGVVSALAVVNAIESSARTDRNLMAGGMRAAAPDRAGSSVA
jgi:predicted NAD/FAD-binding protein